MATEIPKCPGSLKMRSSLDEPDPPHLSDERHRATEAYRTASARWGRTSSTNRISEVDHQRVHSLSPRKGMMPHSNIPVSSSPVIALRPSRKWVGGPKLPFSADEKRGSKTKKDESTH